MSAYKPAGIHISSKIANNPLKVRLILVPFFMQRIRHMADGIFGDFNKAAYRLWGNQTGNCLNMSLLAVTWRQCQAAANYDTIVSR